MKNLLILVFLMLVFSSSKGQKDKANDKIVYSFVEEWLSSSGSEECALKFLNIHKSYLDTDEAKNFFFEWFASFCQVIKGEIEKSNGEYQIIKHKHNTNNEAIKKFNLSTNDYSGVYYLIINGEVVTSLIVKNSRIISYCVIMVHPNKSRFNRPWLINEALKQE